MGSLKLHPLGSQISFKQDRSRLTPGLAWQEGLDLLSSLLQVIHTLKYVQTSLRGLFEV